VIVLAIVKPLPTCAQFVEDGFDVGQLVAVLAQQSFDGRQAAGHVVGGPDEGDDRISDLRRRAAIQ
jgi:hypothetical protein